MPEIALRQGRIHYREAGRPDGPPVLLVHGVLADGRLWDPIVPALAAAGLRVIAPDLPLGFHKLALPPQADRTAGGIAALLGDLVEALDLDDATLVANDSGGAFTQILLASGHPAVARIGRVVLATTDALEVFPPRLFAPLVWLGRTAAGPRILAALLGVPPLRRALFALVTSAGVPEPLAEDWVAALRGDAAVRADLRGVLAGAHPSATLHAATRLHVFPGPVLLAWAAHDRFFTRLLAERLAACFADARIAWIEGTRTFVPLDRPDELAELVAAFAPAPPDGRAHAAGTAVTGAA